jgi:hypothetical protein
MLLELLLMDRYMFALADDAKAEALLDNRTDTTGAFLFLSDEAGIALLCHSERK